MQTAYQRSKKWRDKHPEAVKVWQAAFYERNSKRLKEEQAEYRLQHKPETKVRNERYYLEHKATLKTATALYQKEHPEKTKVYRSTRRTKSTQAGGAFTSAEWEALCTQYGYRCLCCHRRRKLEADHVIPVSKGGDSNIQNIQPLCRTCNAKKGIDTTDYREEEPIRKVVRHN